MTVHPHDELPTLEPGLTYLDAEDPRAAAVHRLALATAEAVEGPAYWIDARNTASTYVLREHATGRRAPGGLRVARAFTAYQHHTLVQTVVDDRDPALVVLPCVDALYADDDVPTAQAEALLDDVLTTLDELAGAVRVLLTAGTPALAATVSDRAAHTIVARETDLGTAFETDAFRTTVYRGPGFWQTTIPYWVDLLGRREPAAEGMPAPERATLAALG